MLSGHHLAMAPLLIPSYNKDNFKQIYELFLQGTRSTLGKEIQFSKRETA
jgi:hypothetical protein